jgi:DNA repair protein RadA/Sms
VQRLLQVLAVLERRAGVSFGQHDVYVSVAGGVRISEPAVDLPLALALLSARKDVALPEGLASFGEIGLGGEIRPVAHAAGRLGEAAAMGLGLVACGPVTKVKTPAGMELRSMGSVAEASALIGT